MICLLLLWVGCSIEHWRSFCIHQRLRLQTKHVLLRKETRRKEYFIENDVISFMQIRVSIFQSRLKQFFVDENSSTKLAFVFESGWMTDACFASVLRSLVNAFFSIVCQIWSGILEYKTRKNVVYFWKFL